MLALGVFILEAIQRSNKAIEMRTYGLVSVAPTEWQELLCRLRMCLIFLRRHEAIEACFIALETTLAETGFGDASLFPSTPRPILSPFPTISAETFVSVCLTNIPEESEMTVERQRLESEDFTSFLVNDLCALTYLATQQRRYLEARGANLLPKHERRVVNNLPDPRQANFEVDWPSFAFNDIVRFNVSKCIAALRKESQDQQTTPDETAFIAELMIEDAALPSLWRPILDCFVGGVDRMPVHGQSETIISNGNSAEELTRVSLKRLISVSRVVVYCRSSVSLATSWAHSIPKSDSGNSAQWRKWRVSSIFARLPSCFKHGNLIELAISFAVQVSAYAPYGHEIEKGCDFSEQSHTDAVHGSKSSKSLIDWFDYDVPTERLSPTKRPFRDPVALALAASLCARIFEDILWPEVFIDPLIHAFKFFTSK